MICISIDNGHKNTVGGSYYSADQAVSKFAEHHIGMVSCVHRKSSPFGEIWGTPYEIYGLQEMINTLTDPGHC